MLKQVDEAKTKLSALKRSRATDEDTLAEIRQLEEFVAVQGARAGQAITASYEERTQG